MSEMSPAEAAIVERFEAAEPAPESWRGDDGLREAVARAVWDSESAGQAWTTWDDTTDRWRDRYREAADRILALPEVAALRAKAAAADRVRELLVRRISGQRCISTVDLDAALDGPPC